MTKQQQHKWLRLLALLLCCLLLAGCSAKEEDANTGTIPTATADEPADPNKKPTGVGFYFDTVVWLTLWGAPEGLADEVWAECTRYEQMLSKTISTSDASTPPTARRSPLTRKPGRSCAGPRRSAS